MRGFAFVAVTFVLACPALARADEVHDALDAYALYQNDVSALLDAEITGDAAVDAALARLRRHDGDRVARGWIAYGALAAAQSPAFAEGVQRQVRQEGRGPVIGQLRTDITYARRAPEGSSQAVRLILTAANADGGRAVRAGARYETYARSGPGLQFASTGSRAELGGGLRLSPEMSARLHGQSVTATSSRQRSDADALGSRTFWDSMAGREAQGGGAGGGREQASYASVTDHMLTLGALIAAGAADDEGRRVNELLDEPLTQQCMMMQRLQLRQCLSVSVDASERAYCLARHALDGPGGCFSNVAQ